jgi:hypothetical protein
MENQASSKNVILNFGTYLGVIGIFIQLIEFVRETHLDNSKISGAVSIISVIVFISLGIKKFKTLNNGLISMGQGLKIGMGITLISLVISVLYMLVFTNFIDPGFKESALEKSVSDWNEQGMSEDKIEQYSEYAKEYFYLSLYGIITVFSLFFGFIISLITGLIMKRTEEDYY